MNFDNADEQSDVAALDPTRPMPYYKEDMYARWEKVKQLSNPHRYNLVSDGGRVIAYSLTEFEKTGLKGKLATVSLK